MGKHLVIVDGKPVFFRKRQGMLLKSFTSLLPEASLSFRRIQSQQEQTLMVKELVGNGKNQPPAEEVGGYTGWWVGPRTRRITSHFIASSSVSGTL